MKETDKKTKIITLSGLILLSLISVVTAYIFSKKFQPKNISPQNQTNNTNPFQKQLPIPPPKNLALSQEKPLMPPLKKYPVPDIKKMKTKGCVADGLLSGYNRPSKDIKVAQKSHCYFFSRAIETWLEAPDFRQAVETMEKINKNNVLYGMFIAEAINKKERYMFYDEGRPFDFSKMCKRGSKNFWGEHTCKPSFAKEEYQKYLRQITQTAMDIGIQVFLFGQIYYQEEDLNHPLAPKIIKEMRRYAKKKNMKIIIGAQTNNITDPSYLKLFDFIEGGVGLYPDGEVENNPCFSRWYNNKTKTGWCWALLWNEPYKSLANNVFVHLDWSGVKGDDMSTFALMDDNLRHQTLKKLHREFTSQNIGFLLPILAPLPKDNHGCHGQKKNFYSPSMKYDCKDLDVINEILDQQK